MRTGDSRRRPSLRLPLLDSSSSVPVGVSPPASPSWRISVWRVTLWSALCRLTLLPASVLSTLLSHASLSVNFVYKPYSLSRSWLKSEFSLFFLLPCTFPFLNLSFRLQHKTHYQVRLPCPRPAGTQPAADKSVAARPETRTKLSRTSAGGSSSA